MYVVGLTGGFASGKTLASQVFAQLHVPIIDADIIARELTLPGTSEFEAIIAHFGHQFLNPEGQLARPKLRARIFRDAADKAWLEALLHPAIQRRIRETLAQLTAAYCVVVVPLLAENFSAYASFVHRVLLIDLPVELQVQRAYQREAISPALAETIIASQASRTARKAIADDIIENHRSPEHLTQAVHALHEQYQQLAHTTAL